MIKKISLIATLVVLLSLTLGFNIALAQTPVTDPPGTTITDDTAQLTNPLGPRKLPEIIGDGIGVGLGVIGAVALALFVYGGFMWMTAAGNTSRVQKGREILIWATVGLVVIFTSYAVLNFVLDAITGR